MSKSQKRKREARTDTTDEEEGSSSKKTKRNEDISVHKKVSRKSSSHNLSCSEDEGSGTGSVRIKSRGHGSISIRNRSPLNTHLLSSESDREAGLSYDFTSRTITSETVASGNGETTDSEHESVHDSEEEVNHVTSTVATSNPSDSRKKLLQIPRFTQELDEEILKFSFLLDESLIEKNDFWVLQCPSNMDCSALVSQRLCLDGSCQLDDGERTYETYSYRNTCTRSATLAVPSERNRLNLCRIPITGSIIVEESVKASKNVGKDEMIPEPPSRVELPENLRTRHPLLGIDFSKQPRTAERDAESTKKKKRHSKKYEERCNGIMMTDLGYSSMSTSSKKKKKNKDRSSADITLSNSAEQLMEESLDDSTKKRKKKKKHKDDDSFI